MQLSDVNSVDVAQAAIEGLDFVLGQMTGPRSDGRRRRRWLTQVRKDCVALKNRWEDRSAMSMVWSSVHTTFAQFLADSPVGGMCWENGEQYFTTWGQTWVKHIDSAFSAADLPSTVALDLLRSFFAEVDANSSANPGCEGDPHCSANAGQSALKLYIPQGQIDQSAYDLQTFKNHIVWVTTESRLGNDNRAGEAGDFFGQLLEPQPDKTELAPEANELLRQHRG